MLYKAYELQRAMLTGASVWASVTSELLSSTASPFAWMGLGPVMGSALNVFAHAAAPRGKPAFDIESITIDGQTHAVTEAIVMHRPFGNLLRFTHDGLAADAPKLLIVAPMSGHYATLLRGTVERLLERAEVYITDWADAREVPLAAGRFDLDDYIDYMMAIYSHLGRCHTLAVCQPSVPVIAAVALMEQMGHPDAPASMILMGGPVDTRQGVTEVN